MRAPRGISFKLAVVFLLIGITPMAIVGVSAYFLARTSMTESYIESFVERVARDAAFVLERSVKNMSDSARVLAVSSNLRQSVFDLSVHLPEDESWSRALDSIRDDLNAWVETLGIVDLLAVCQTDGRVIMTSNIARPGVRSGPHVRVGPRTGTEWLWTDINSNPLSDASFEDRDWWVSARTGALTAIPWNVESTVLTSYEYPRFLDQSTRIVDRQRLKNPEALSFGFAQGIPYPKGESEDSERPQAILVALFNWSAVQDVLDRITADFQQHYRQYASGYPFLFDRDLDTVIAHDDLRNYGTHLIADHGLRSLHDAMQASPGAEGHHYYSYLGHPKVAGFSSVPNTGWEMGFGINEADVYTEVVRLRNLLLVCGLIFAGIIVVVIAWASRRLTKPLTTLILQTNEIARGNLDAHVDIQTNDEIGLLGDSFNKMAEDLKASNKRLIQAEKTAAWREMARQVAHEIKNPLTPIKLSVQLMERAWSDRHPDFEKILKDSVKSVVEQIESLRKIASDFSAYATFPATERKAHSLKEILESCIRLYANRDSSGIDVGMESSIEDVQVAVDRDELKRVFLNLFNNAFEAMPEGGRLSLSSYVLARGDGQRIVEIRVKDTGCGIPREALDRLFEPYFTTRSSGTGLGLAICKRTIEGYGGTIRLESEIGRGTTAIVTLPALG